MTNLQDARIKKDARDFFVLSTLASQKFSRRCGRLRDKEKFRAAQRNTLQPAAAVSANHKI